MKAIFYLNDATHQTRHQTWTRKGFHSHGWDVVTTPRHDFDLSADLIVVWGWRLHKLFEKAKSAGIPVLVLERGHLQPRFQWTSMGFNGLGGYAEYAPCLDDGERFMHHYGHFMQDWGSSLGTTMVMGQVNGDASMHGAHPMLWAEETCEAYLKLGHDVIYRPHPLSAVDWCPEGAVMCSGKPLDEVLSRVGLVVTYTSTSGVEAVLSGVPTVACNKGSMAWPVASHGVGSKPMKPDRFEWASRLAWSQYSPGEIDSGFAWECIKDVIPKLR